MKHPFRPDNASPNAPYSMALGVGNLVMVSGQGPINPDTKLIEGETFEEQVELTFRNVDAALRSAGCVLDDCIKVNAYLLDMQNFDRFNAVYIKHFSQPLPARTTVGAALWNGIQVEIDAIAIRNCHKKA